jgi:hypothetical protein
MQAPECPWWCTATHGAAGWDDEQNGAATKVCRRVVPSIDDVDGATIHLIVERFAAEDETAEPVIRIEGHGALTLDAALSSAWTVIRIAEMITGPPPLALTG